MTLFVFGSTGDLVKRKVMKALQEIGGNFKIYAVGRREMDHTEYKNFICSDWCRLDFRERINYLKVDFSELDLEKYLEFGEVNYFYLSLPPQLVGEVLDYLVAVKKKGYKIKILSEKPFGENLESSIYLKNKIEKLNLEKDFLISDHYLFKKNFFNLPQDFHKVKIVSVEKVGLEGRVSFYDSVGALRDMIQSHFLNLVMKNLGVKFDLEKIQIKDFVRGQYKGYSEELGGESLTETFVRMSFVCCDKEFEFITGKAFSRKEGFVELDLKKFEMGDDNSYVLVFRNFLEGKNDLFPTIDEEILTWKIIEKIEEKKPELFIYEKGLSDFENIK